MARTTGTNIAGPRPPSFVSKATLAAELDIGESTVDDLVKRGVLPRPIRIGGSVRWSWAAVQEALTSMGTGEAMDPFLRALSDEAAA
jgi:predicted DNA-binding transcriptional regulator AlpA